VTTILREPARSRVAAQAKADYESGAIIREVAADIGMSYTATRQLLLSAGVRFRPRFGADARTLSPREADARQRVCSTCKAPVGKGCRTVNNRVIPAHVPRRQSPPTSRG
jgi:hypothetical protein